MTVLWLCNSGVPKACESMEIDGSPKEGWLVQVADKIENMASIQFIYVFHSALIQEAMKKVEMGNTTFICLQENTASIKNIEIYANILKLYDPDIIHIWGTEEKKSYYMTEAAREVGLIQKVVVSIQGLVGPYAYHYMGNIPGIVQLAPSLRDIVRSDSLARQQNSFWRRGIYERKCIENVEHVIGRTFWDRACAYSFNPKAHYHFNNETLRSGFYESAWSASTCNKHEIFVSQAAYPLKGFHYVLEAVGMLKNRYPDIRIVVAGADNSFKPRYLETAYGRYLRKLIKKNDLSNAISYVGMLSEDDMVKQYLEAEVFVSPSAIENSPNSVGEAMILGMPVISSNVGGVSDLLTHGEEGFLYQADAPYLLAYYISILFENSDLERTLGTNARKHALETHDPDKNFSELLKIYANIFEVS